MTARILVVDDILPNIKLLEAKLTSEYYEVVCASSGFEALQLAETQNPDLILLDIMMPGMDGFEACTKLKANPKTEHIPVVMVTALDQPEDKVKGLSCGADDFLTKPVEDLPLMARVRSLTRLKMMNDELRMRQNTETRFGIAPQKEDAFKDANVLIVDSNLMVAEKMLERLPEGCHGDIETNPDNVTTRLHQKEYALCVVSLNLNGYDGLRVCSAIRSSEVFRRVCLIAAGEDTENLKLVKALDLGVNDFIKRPIDYNEFLARVKSQIKRYHYSERLRKHVENSVEYAVVDPMTGLHNRRYLNMHLDGLCQKAYEVGKPLSVAMLDIDHFKSVNDTYGHDVGDQVLVQFADRIKNHIRNFDMGVRYGGEEFTLLMPETDLAQASVVAERIRDAVASKPFQVSTAKGLLDISCSIGVARLSVDGENPDQLLKRADAALYRAKHTGRNRVVMHKGKPQAQGNSGSQVA
ncbi:MAG: PleD family two-component system response regulator [Pseudomonadota bacterium]